MPELGPALRAPPHSSPSAYTVAPAPMEPVIISWCSGPKSASPTASRPAVLEPPGAVGSGDASQSLGANLRPFHACHYARLKLYPLDAHKRVSVT